MARRGKRRRLARNIYADGSGLSGIVEVRGTRRELRFPPGTTISQARLEMDTARTRLEDLNPEIARGTLADVVKKSLSKLADGPQKAQREDLLMPWVSAFPPETIFSRITRAELTDQLEKWRQAGLSASRANKRISALRVAWRALHPDDPQSSAIERVTRYSEPRPIQRGVPMAVITQILEAVEDDGHAKTKGAPIPPSKSKARLRLLAWTGQPPARIMAIKAEHVRWTSTPPELYVMPRRKGAGSDDAWLPLLPEAVEALKAFAKADAWGTFATSALGRTFKRAVKKVQADLRKARQRDAAAALDSLTVYSLRHSFLSALAETTDDIYAVKEYAGHASLQTTLRYMKGAAKARMSAAIGKLSAVPKIGATIGLKRRRGTPVKRKAAPRSKTRKRR